MTWFQLYPPNDRDIGFDMLRRAEDCGVETLVVTADAGAEPSREDAAFRGPVEAVESIYTPRVIKHDVSSECRWMLMNGAAFPEFVVCRPVGNMSVTEFIGSQLNGSLDWDYLELCADAGRASFC